MGTGDFHDGLIDQGHGWLELLDDRNAMSHTYDEFESHEIFKRIVTEYLSLFQNLRETLSRKSHSEPS